MNKAFATEMILTVGVLIASGILLLELRGVLYGQTKISQEEVVSTFADDIENIVDKVAAVTGNATFVYYPTIKSYTLTVKNDTVLINDKISEKTAIFTKTSVDLQDVVFEDSKMIYITKVEDNVYITGKCKEVGESCSNSVMCCPGVHYCWGSSFVCHVSCAPNGEYAVDDQACCSGLLNKTTGKCDEIPVCTDSKCDGTADSEKWIDTLGNVCCPSSRPVCSEKNCCEVDKPKYCLKSKAGMGNPRCMSELEYENDCERCKKYYKIVVVANNYNDLVAYRTRADKEMNIVLQESPFRECPSCLNITILNLNCPAVCNEFTASSCTIQVMNCVHQNYGNDYNLIFVLNGDDFWCNGFSMIGSPFTICGNGLPSALKDYCAIHEIGHNIGDLCDEYGYSYWLDQGCPSTGWSQFNLKKTGGCNEFNCGGLNQCCGTKLNPNDPSDRTVDIMGGGGGMIGCSGMYVFPIHFRDYNYNRFRDSLPIQDYCP